MWCRNTHVSSLCICSYWRLRKFSVEYAEFPHLMVTLNNSVRIQQIHNACDRRQQVGKLCRLLLGQSGCRWHPVLGRQRPQRGCCDMQTLLPAESRCPDMEHHPPVEGVDCRGAFACGRPCHRSRRMARRRPTRPSLRRCEDTVGAGDSRVSQGRCPPDWGPRRCPRRRGWRLPRRPGSVSAPRGRRSPNTPTTPSRTPRRACTHWPRAPPHRASSPANRNANRRFVWS